MTYTIDTTDHPELQEGEAACLDEIEAILMQRDCVLLVDEAGWVVAHASRLPPEFQTRVH